MPRTTLQEELELIASVVGAHPVGIGIADIELEMTRRQGTKPNRRTLQRRLQRLVVERHLTTDGESVALVYKPAAGTVPDAGARAAAKTDGIATAEPYVPVSPEGAAIRDQVRQLLMYRKPVGYQREFLEAYQPGITFYLPDSLRRQLHEMGRTFESERPAGTYARDILGRLLVDLSWASSKLEGNTYSRLDTRALIAHGQQAQGHGVTETQMILNHKAAIELLMDHVEAPQFSRYLLMNLHSALSENLLESPEDEGRLRLHPVQIGQSAYQPPSGQSLIGSLLDEVLAKFNAIEDPFEQAFFAMVHLPYLQPFADCNKRCSRLLANWPLLRANLCPLTFLGVSQAWYTASVLGVYEMTRVELLRDLFMWAYERSTKEYLSAKSRVVEPDLLRLTWREAIRQTVKAVVQNPEQDPLALVDEQVALAVPGPQREDVRALVMQELRRLHEGVLVRYGLRPVELERWRSIQG